VLGFWLGGFAFARAHIELLLVAVVTLSLVPLAVEFVKGRRNRDEVVESG
jgi:membrane-associated protein